MNGVPSETRTHSCRSASLLTVIPPEHYEHIGITVCYISFYEHLWVCPIPYKYVRHYCEAGGVMCWLSRQLLSRDSLTWILGKPSIHVTWPTLLELPWRRPFLRKYRQSQWHFCSRPVCLGYTPAFWPILKKVLCRTWLVSGAYNKYHLCWLSSHH